MTTSTTSTTALIASLRHKSHKMTTSTTALLAFFCQNGTGRAALVCLPNETQRDRVHATKPRSACARGFGNPVSRTLSLSLSFPAHISTPSSNGLRASKSRKYRSESIYWRWPQNRHFRSRNRTGALVFSSTSMC